MRELSKKILEITDNIVKITYNTVNMFKKETDTFIMPQLEEIQQNRKENEVQVSRLANMVKELELQKAVLQKELSNLKCEEKNQKDVVKRVEHKTNALAKSYDKIKHELHTASQALEISPTDIEILDINRKKLSIYKDLTNVVWDYTLPLHNSTVIGYVENSKCNYIQAFSFGNNAELTENLWKEVEKGIESDWRNFVGMKREQIDVIKTKNENENI